jgi:hypothetical protein
VRMCQPHWERLKTAIADRGMDGLVSQDGAELVARMREQMESGATRDNFDPLMAAHNLILRNAMNVAGLDLMTPNDDGTDRCPICYLSDSFRAQCERTGRTFESYDCWCEKAADDVLAAWREGPPAASEGAKA